MLKNANAGKLVLTLLTPDLQRSAVDSALSYCGNSQLVELYNLYYCNSQKRLQDAIRHCYSEYELRFLSVFLTSRNFYVKYLVRSAPNIKLATLVLSLQTAELDAISKYFYMKTKHYLYSHVGHQFKNQMSAYLLHSWCNQCRFARHQMQVEAYNLLTSSGPQYLIQLLCTSIPGEFIEIARNFKLMAGSDIYGYLKEKATFGSDLYYFGYACAVLEGTAIDYVASQSDFLGNYYQDVLQMVILLFREHEYGRKEYKQTLYRSLGQLGDLICSLSGIK